MTNTQVLLKIFRIIRNLAFHEDTLSHAVDEACHHEHRVKVPQPLQVHSLCHTPGEGKPLSIPAILNNPVECQGNHSMKEDFDQDDEKAETAAGTSGHLLSFYWCFIPMDIVWSVSVLR